MLKNNLAYWNISKNNPEPLLDEYYLIDVKILPSQLEAIKNLREILRKICEDDAFQDKNRLEMLAKCLNEDGVQYTEFVAFMNAFDVSLSTFKKWTLSEKIDALRIIVKKYCEKRYPLYKSVADDSILIPRAMMDKGASRWKAEAGKEKIKTILKEFGAEDTATLSGFLSKEIAYLDINHHEQEFRKLKEALRLRKRFDKNPDLLIKINKHILVVEAKHIKEPGGAQDKSLLELCNFVGYEEKGLKDLIIHYVAFLDGIYANDFFNLRHQYSERAVEALRNCPSNYFVNTRGFKEIVKDLLR